MSDWTIAIIKRREPTKTQSVGQKIPWRPNSQDRTSQYLIGEDHYQNRQRHWFPFVGTTELSV